MAENPRIEELRRRVQSDPASIAFAALAEEYRRAGQFEEAITTCKTGLKRHPAYLSAHVTLGRALLEVGQYEEAREQLEYVLKIAPENLAAIRGLAEIHHRLRDTDHEHHDAPPEPAASRAVAPAAPARRPIPVEPAAAVPLVRTEAPAADRPAPWDVAVTAPAADRPAPWDVAAPPAPAPAAPAADRPASWHVAAPAPAPAAPAFQPPAVDPALAALEEFLGAILRARRELDGPGAARP